MMELDDVDVRIALTHYSPIPETLRGEPPEIYPFLGAYQLGEVIDECGALLAIHGHAHFGCEQGVPPAESACATSPIRSSAAHMPRMGSGLDSPV